MNKPPLPFPGAMRVPPPAAAAAPAPVKVPAPPTLNPRAALEQSLQPGDVLPNAAFMERPGIPAHPAASLDLAQKHGIVRGGTLHSFNPITKNWEPNIRNTQQPAQVPPPPPAVTEPPVAAQPVSAPEPQAAEESEPFGDDNQPTVFEIARARDMLWEAGANPETGRQDRP